MAQYPGWRPKRCIDCRKRTGPAARRAGSKTRPSRGVASAREENLTVAEVLEKYTAGPTSGAFTDGAAEPNPGPGGWGVVYVVDNRVVAEECGHEPHTTNNRMELVALIAGCRLVPPNTPSVLYTDSELCVNTVTQWAKGWEARGWKRKGGEIKNLDLVKELYGTLKTRPELRVQWIQAHAGFRWNEYADSLATSYRRSKR